MVLLVMAYSKKEKEDLSPAEKKAIKSVIANIKKDLSQKLFPDEE